MYYVSQPTCIPKRDHSDGVIKEFSAASRCLNQMIVPIWAHSCWESVYTVWQKNQESTSIRPIGAEGP